MIFVIIALAIFFALNMGGASFAASFAAAYGGKALSRNMAIVLFIAFVVLGAFTFGQYVSVTLGEKIIPSSLIDYRVLIVIFLSAGLSMFIANMMRIPQTTSLVTVATIVGVGLYFHQVNVQMLFYMIPFWILLPIISFIATYVIGGYIYPPREINFWIYEKLVNQRERLKTFVIICSCYNAFSVGANNVANVVGPLKGAGIIDLMAGLVLFGFIYGAGSKVFTGPLKTAGDKIVPLGLLTASIISFVSGTLMIAASMFGVPQSFVMLQMGAIFAIGTLKHGKSLTFNDPIAKKVFFTWTVNPLLTLLVSYGLCFLIIGKV